MKQLVEFIAFLEKEKSMILEATLQHLGISFFAVFIGMIIAIPAGVALTRNQKAANGVMGVVGVFQTIPSLVMFGLSMPLFGIGVKAAVIVMILYSLLPILTNTYTGIKDLDPKYIEAARGMGMSVSQVIMKVELPLALPAIVSGVRLSMVYIISWATIGALIGAGGLGDLIFTGLQTYNYNMILAGSIPASLLALLAGGVIGLIEKRVSGRKRQRHSLPLSGLKTGEEGAK